MRFQRGGAEIVTHWKPDEALDRCPAGPFRERVWRIHPAGYDATDWNGSLRESGRYHCGLDQFPEDRAWPALYTSKTPESCILEITGRNWEDLDTRTLEDLDSYLLTELDVSLATILNCTNPDLLGLSRDDIIRDSEYRVTQAIGSAANAAGYEGLLTPSATEISNNLVIFPRNLRPRSRVVAIRSYPPRAILHPYS